MAQIVKLSLGSVRKASSILFRTVPKSSAHVPMRVIKSFHSTAAKFDYFVLKSHVHIDCYKRADSFSQVDGLYEDEKDALVEAIKLMCIGNDEDGYMKSPLWKTEILKDARYQDAFAGKSADWVCKNIYILNYSKK